MAEPSDVVVPQAVLSPLTRTAIFLVVTIDPGGETVARDLLSALSGLQRAVGFREPYGKLSCVAGVGSQASSKEAPPAGREPGTPGPVSGQ